MSMARVCAERQRGRNEGCSASREKTELGRPCSVLGWRIGSQGCIAGAQGSLT